MINKEYVEAIISLTEQFNQQVLMSRLASGVHDIVPTSDIKVYDIFNSANETEFSSANIDGARIRDAQNPGDQSEYLQDHEGFVHCVIKKEVVKLPVADASRTRVVFPVPGLNHVVGLAVVECDADDADSLFLLESLVRIYGNQNFLLTRNERDALTGLLNRGAFDDRLSKIMGRMTHEHRKQAADKICLAIVDVDHFKQVNDQFGHLFGDEVLLHLSQIMTRSFRHYDQLFRYGGEEFAVLLHNSDVDTAMLALDRFRTSVENHLFPQVGYKTVSAGVVQISPNELPPLTISKADQALYYAKENGRNQVCSFEYLQAEGKIEQKAAPASGDVELF